LVGSSERKAGRAKKKITRIGAAVKNCGLFSPPEITLHSNHIVWRDLIVPAAISASAQGDVEVTGWSVVAGGSAMAVGGVPTVADVTFASTAS
jgi:hypothetical protein